MTLLGLTPLHVASPERDGASAGEWEVPFDAPVNPARRLSHTGGRVWEGGFSPLLLLDNRTHHTTTLLGLTPLHVASPERDRASAEEEEMSSGSRVQLCSQTRAEQSRHPPQLQGI